MSYNTKFESYFKVMDQKKCKANTWDLKPHDPWHVVAKNISSRYIQIASIY